MNPSKSRFATLQRILLENELAAGSTTWHELGKEIICFAPYQPLLAAGSRVGVERWFPKLIGFSFRQPCSLQGQPSHPLADGLKQVIGPWMSGSSCVQFAVVP